ncbi:monocarboxylate transporter 13-like [Patiria miniata]|uniref:Major facilitator superfamily (MFS) profile domain-containing protein n=1 Tax=Patiria miniata TaxID=46514 RepID=A0A914AX27_PATMI|nr:monocarboxylate transporter 13-like [Patiria miniata]
MMSVGHPHENDVISYTDTVSESVGSLRGLGRANAGRRRGRPRWGRMVVSTSFLTFLLQAGSSMTHGLYMPAFLEEFQAGTGLIGWLTSFSAAVMCLGGPIGGVIVKRLGCRPSVMLGGAMMATGNGLASLCTTIVQLFLCLGLVGLGGSMVSVGLVVAIGQYYTRHHSIANGLAFSGIGAGIFVFSPLVRFLIDNYGWRGSFLVQAGILLNLEVTGALLRPASRYKVRNSRKEKMQSVTESGNNDSNFEEGDESVVLDGSGEHEGTQSSKCTGRSWSLGWLGKFNGLFYLGLCELFRTAPSVVQVYAACFLLDAGVSAVMSHISNLDGVTPQQASSLLPYLGIGSLVGRLIHGGFLKCKHVTPYRMYIAALLVSAPSATLIAITGSFGGRIVEVVIFGFASGSLYPLVAVILRELVGISQLGLAFGLSMFAYGVGGQLGGFIIGVLRDSTGNYTLSFYLVGLFFVIAATVMSLRPLIECRRRRRLTMG